jgi:hypothetical protein
LPLAFSRNTDPANRRTLYYYHGGKNILCGYLYQQWLHEERWRASRQMRPAGEDSLGEYHHRADVRHRVGLQDPKPDPLSGQRRRESLDPFSSDGFSLGYLLPGATG